MIEIEIPGYRHLKLRHLVLDYNGTLAVDGRLLPGVKECLEPLADKLEVHVLTADTFGTAGAGLQGVTCKFSVIPQGNQHVAKLEYVKRLGLDSAVCIGNGRNDRLMLREAALGIAVILEEGVAFDALTDADIACNGIESALKLLLNPLRLVATLRS